MSLQNTTAQEIEAVFDYSLGLVLEDEKPNIMAAKAMAYIHCGDLERASEILGAVHLGPARGKQVEAVRTILEQRLA